MPAFDKRSLTFLGMPKEEHIEIMKNSLMNYRGRICATFDKCSVASIIGRVVGARFEEVDNKVTLITDVKAGGKVPFVVDIYLDEVRTHYIAGLKPDPNVSKNNYPGKVSLPDLY